MNARDQMKSWPSLAGLTSGEILAASAWRCPVEFDGAEAELTHAADPVAEDELFLSLTFDGDPHVLGLGDSARYPDLHLLWSRRGELPDELLIALVEKECGAVLQLLENLSRCEIKLCGIAARPTSAERLAFGIGLGGETLTLTLDLPAALTEEFGRLDCLDPAHSFVRGQTRAVRAAYATLPLEADGVSELKEGDYLVLEDLAPEWLTELPDDGKLRLAQADEVSATFAQFADGTLPAVPALDAAPLRLFVGNRAAFAAEPSRVGTARAVRIGPPCPPVVESQAS